VTCIVAALIAGHDIETFRQQIDYFSLALVTPLRTKDDYVTHAS
jgi:hypothetical protein